MRDPADFAHSDSLQLDELEFIIPGYGYPSVVFEPECRECEDGRKAFSRVSSREGVP